MLIAIKGLIGSGKTTTAEYLHQKYNVYHYNCDQRVKKIYSTHKEVIELVNKHILNTESDVIDMQQLKIIAFGNKDKLLELESIVYPYLEAEIDSVCDQYDIVLIDGQQIDKLDLEFDYSICLKLDDKLIIDRVAKRDGRTKEEIEQILDIQKSYEQNSDFTIENNGSENDLKSALDTLMEAINEKANR